MGVFKRNGVYYIDYRIHGRRFRKRIGSNKQLAKDTLASIEGDKVRGYYRIMKTQRVRFSDFAKTYMDRIKSLKKISWLRDQVALKSMLPHFGPCYLDAINARLIEDYQGKRVKQVRPATVNREMIILRHMLGLAIKWEMLQTNPFKNVRFLRVDNVQDRILTDEEVGKLLRACNGHVYPVVFTALHTGMRLSEILTLKWSQVDLQQEGITVVTTKNN
ncbi:MAG: tyrosine-type recombinase/integrase, partial [Desulfocucumaceae bacterium]